MSISMFDDANEFDTRGMSSIIAREIIANLYTRTNHGISLIRLVVGKDSLTNLIFLIF